MEFKNLVLGCEDVFGKGSFVFICGLDENRFQTGEKTGMKLYRY